MQVWPPLLAALRKLLQWRVERGEAAGGGNGRGGGILWRRQRGGGNGVAEQQDVHLASLDAHPPADKNSSFKLSRPPSPPANDKPASVTRL